MITQSRQHRFLSFLSLLTALHMYKKMSSMLKLTGVLF